MRCRATKADWMLYLEKIEQSLPHSPLSKKYSTSFEGYTTFFRAVQFYWKGFLRPFGRRELYYMKWNFFAGPIEILYRIKRTF